MAVKSSSVAAPLTVGLPGSLAGAAGVALQVDALRVTVYLLGGEGPRVEVEGASGTPYGRAAYWAALGLLDLLGEEAFVRVRVEAGEYPEPMLVAGAAAGSLAALTSLLGVAPDPQDVMRVANTAVARAYGRPMPPLVAAALLGGVAAGSEQAPFMARLAGEGVGELRVGVVHPCKPVELPEVCTAAERYVQLVQLAAVLSAALSGGGWRAELAALLRSESPWDYVLPRGAKEALGRAIGAGAYAAGLDPYTGSFVAVASQDTAVDAVERMASTLAAWQGCEPRVVVAGVKVEPLLPVEASS